MQVILLEKITKLGDLGDEVKVRNGFGRNFLIPYGKALPATKDNKITFDAKRAKYEEKQTEVRAEAEELAAKIGEVPIILNRAAGVSERLFGSVTNSDIAAFFLENDIDVPRRVIEVGRPIRTLGEHTISLRLHPDVMLELDVQVERSAK